MSTRRDFLQSCIALTGGLAASVVFAGVPLPYDRFRPQRAIFDDGFIEARAFARAARELGMETHAISGDVTALWYKDLYFQWQRGSGAVAGLTGASALFCLEKLAWDAGHRVVLRVDHTRAPGGGVKHTFAGPKELLHPASPALLQRHSNWGAGMAQLVTQCPSSTGSGAQRTVVDSSASADHWCESLVSWVIARRTVS